MANKVMVFVSVMALTAAGVGTVSFPAADASTAACGSWCTSPTVQSVGTGQALAVSSNSVVMAAASTSNSGEDWTPEVVGDVADAISAGVVSARLDMQYHIDQLVEYQYAPNGVPSDQCLSDSDNGPSLGITPEFSDPNLSVVLAQCGVTAQSLWIVDANNAANGYVDLINAGYEASFSYLAQNTSTAENLASPYAEPAVLTVNSSGKVVLAFLSEIGGVVSPTQMWANWSAPAQAGLRTKVAKSR